MADTPDADAIRKELEKQIADLKKEVTKLGKSLSSFEVACSASWIDTDFLWSASAPLRS